MEIEKKYENLAALFKLLANPIRIKNSGAIISKL